MQYHLAVDIGASSGRHILGHVEDGCIVLEEVYRFDNVQKTSGGHDCWDTQLLWTSILEGLRACKSAGKIPTTMGIDTWAVDFVLVDGAGAMIGDAVAYRDARTEGVRDALEANGTLSFADHYARAGIQYQPFNTAYQLAALKQEHPEQLEQAARMLMIPEYFHYLLTGNMVAEYTNATSTALVNAKAKTWDDELIAALGLPRRIFGELHMPGTSVGHFTPEIQAAVGFDCEVVLPATHDTASAFLAVPARDDSSVTLSSGTWSLLGVENPAPILTDESREANFTNEGGYEYRFRYLKNIMGLWMIQSVRRELNGVAYIAGKQQRTAAEKQWSYGELETEARKCEAFTGRVDANDPRFLAPESMIGEIKAACADSSSPVPETVGEVMACIYNSLAGCYAEAVAQLARITGRQFTAVCIVGGGSKDGYLNALTAKATGLPVSAGPTEGTALGNLIVQFIRAGEFDSLAAARAAIRKSFPIREFQPV